MNPYRQVRRGRRGKEVMLCKIIRQLSLLFVMLCLLPGCATLRSGQESNGGAPVVTQLAKTGHSWNGVLLPAYPVGRPEVTILRITIPAGARLETHRHPVINAGVLTSGQLTVVTADGKTLHLKAGDPIVEVVNTLHYGMNEGQVSAEIIVFYAGVTDAPITVLEPR